MKEQIVSNTDKSEQQFLILQGLRSGLFEKTNIDRKEKGESELGEAEFVRWFIDGVKEAIDKMKEDIAELKAENESIGKSLTTDERFKEIDKNYDEIIESVDIPQIQKAQPMMEEAEKLFGVDARLDEINRNKRLINILEDSIQEFQKVLGALSL